MRAILIGGHKHGQIEEVPDGMLYVRFPKPRALTAEPYDYDPRYVTIPILQTVDYRLERLHIFGHRLNVFAEVNLLPQQRENLAINLLFTDLTKRALEL